jgi:tRNA A-37 threonylcarbamoyl transferase component Bud32
MSALPELESRFDVLAKLGEGGMGTVYKVRHRDLDEVQIVKTLQAHLSSNPDLRERFINEARRGMKLRHPHIAGVHDFAVTADGTGYIVMEFVGGENLKDVLAKKGPLPLELIGHVAEQALDALAYLHAEKFVHRDISPDNLMLTTTAEGRPFVKLIDLGIAKSLESGQTLTMTGQFVGKISYASPEQFGGQLDGRSDLYSLGVVLYKLLTNADPFTGATYHEIIRAHLFQPPRPFDVTAPGRVIPEPVQQVIYRALEKDPDKRFADAAEFRDEVIEAFQLSAVRTRTAAVRTAAARTAVSQTAVSQTAVSGTVPDTTVLDSTRVVPDAGPALPRRAGRLPVIAAVALIVLLAAGYFVWQRVQAARLASYGKFYAVVIGESQYRIKESLPTAVNDARAVAQALERDYGYEVTKLENATAPAILGAIRATGSRMTPQDNLIIYYAGHGELRNERGYWLPVDADFEMTNWISPALIKDSLLDHPARRTLIIADSCYSGAIARGVAPQGASAKARRSRLVLSAGGTAPVIDSADGRHSLFTGALLEILQETRGVVDAQSMFGRIRTRVNDAARRAGREQNPELAVLAEVGDEGGTYYFVRR